MSAWATGYWEALPLMVEVDHRDYGVICVGHGAMLSPNHHLAADRSTLRCQCSNVVRWSRPITTGHILYDIFTRSNPFGLAQTTSLSGTENA